MRNNQQLHIFGAIEYQQQSPRHQLAINQPDQFLGNHKFSLPKQLNTHEVITHKIVSIQPAAVVGSCMYGCKPF